MNAFDFLKRREIGFSGSSVQPTRTKRDWRGFFLCLLAGGRPVVMNVELRGVQIHMSGVPQAVLVNNTFFEPENHKGVISPRGVKCIVSGRSVNNSRTGPTYADDSKYDLVA